MWWKGVALLCFLGTAVLAQDPILKITDTNPPSHRDQIKAMMTTDVTMSCYVTNRQPSMKVRWGKLVQKETGGEDLFPISRDMQVQDNVKYGIEQPTSETWRLRVKSLLPSDEARYMCYIQVTLHNRVWANRTIIVTQAPVILDQHSSNDMTVREGDRVEMRCNATGKPNPTLTWSRGGNAVLPGGGVVRNNWQLVIPEVSYAARGRYRCQAYSEVGYDARSIRLFVKFAPKISFDAPTIGQSPGYRTHVLCDIQSNPVTSRGSVVFIKDGNTVLPGGRFRISYLVMANYKVSYELEINGVRNEDYGSWTCRAQNNEGIGSGRVELYKSAVPQPDKTGRIIAGASSIFSSLMTITLCLLLTTYNIK